MAAGGEGGGTASAIRAGRAFVEVFLDDKRFNQGLSGLRSTMLKWSKSLSLGGFGAALGGAAVLGPLLALGKAALDVGGNFQDMADRLGAPVEELQALGYAAELAGSGLEDVEGMLGKMQNAIADGKTVGGLNLGSLAGQDLATQINAIADALANVETQEQRTQMATDIFGKSGRKLAGIMKDGAAGMEKFRQEAAKAVGMTKEEAERLDSIGDSLASIWTAIKSVGRTIGGALFGDAAAIEAAKNQFLDLAAGLRAIVSNNAPLIQGLAAVAAGVVVIGTALGGLGTALALAQLGIAAVGTILATVFSTTGAIAIGIAALVAGVGYMAYKFTDIGTHFTKAWNGIIGAVKGGQLELAFKILFAGVKLEFAELMKSMSSGWAATALIAAAAAKGWAMGGFAGSGAAAAGATATLLATNTAALQGIESGKAELAALLAQVNTKGKEIEKRVNNAAREAMIIGGPTKGGFGTMGQLRQQLSVADQVNQKIANNTEKTATGVTKTNDLLQRMQTATWAV
jgi:hypothetical protein